MSANNFTKTTNYFHSLIDRNGIVQFTKYFQKDISSGYAIEDQARALIVLLKLRDSQKAQMVWERILSYVQGETIYTIYDALENKWTKPDHSGEAAAQLMWAISSYESIHAPLHHSKPLVPFLTERLILTTSPRAAAYGLLAFSLTKNTDVIGSLAHKLSLWHTQSSDGDWQWFEDGLYYANALFPWALIRAYEITRQQSLFDLATKSLQFLIAHTQTDGIPTAIGNHFWWKKDGKKALFDQQPVDIAYIVCACMSMYSVTKDIYFKNQANNYFSWFEGNNIIHTSLIREDGGICDGLMSHGVNQNAGAESTICFLLAAFELGLI